MCACACESESWACTLAGRYLQRGRGGPGPQPAFPGTEQDTRALDKEFSGLQRQPQPRPEAGVSHTRSPCPTPGVPAQFRNKITPKSAWGPRRRGDQKGKGPGGEKGVLFPFAGEELAPVSSLPRSSPPTPPHPSDLQLRPQSSLSSPTLLPLAPPGAAQSSSWATSSSPSPGVPQLRPHSPPPSPQR